jgi:glycerol-3-phosphate O-acyltransferase
LIEAAHKLAADGLVTLERAGRSDAEPIYRVPENTRILLDYYKNGVVNYFAPSAIAARCIVRHPPDKLPTYQDMQGEMSWLSRLFKGEFLYPVDATFDNRFADTLATLAVRGYIDVFDDADGFNSPEGRGAEKGGRGPGHIVVRDRDALTLLAALLDPFVEAYWITAESLTLLRSFPLWEKELSLRALERCRRAYLEGRISRPEAANQTLVNNALAWFKKAGVVEVRPTGKKNHVALSAPYAEDGLDRLIGDIGRYLSEKH